MQASANRPSIDEILAIKNGRSLVAALTPSLRDVVNEVDPGLVDVFDATFEAGVELEAAEVRAFMLGRSRPPTIDDIQGAGPGGKSKDNLISLFIGVFGSVIASQVVDPAITRLAGSHGVMTALQHFEELISESSLSSTERVRLRNIVERDPILRAALDRTIITVRSK